MKKSFYNSIWFVRLVWLIIYWVRNGSATVDSKLQGQRKQLKSWGKPHKIIFPEKENANWTTRVIRLQYKFSHRKRYRSKVTQARIDIDTRDQLEHLLKVFQTANKAKEIHSWTWSDNESQWNGI